MGIGENDFVKDLCFVDGKVVEMGDDLKLVEGEEVIDVKGCLVLLGLIDVYMYFKYIVDVFYGVVCMLFDVNSIVEM